MLCLGLLCVPVSKMRPTAIASLLYAVSAFGRFRRTTLSDSGGSPDCKVIGMHMERSRVGLTVTKLERPSHSAGVLDSFIV